MGFATEFRFRLKGLVIMWMGAWHKYGDDALEPKGKVDLSLQGVQRGLLSEDS